MIYLLDKGLKIIKCNSLGGVCEIKPKVKTEQKHQIERSKAMSHQTIWVPQSTLYAVKT